MLSCVLIVVGALNWGLVGLGALVSSSDWNVVHMLLGSWPAVESIVYVLVGLAGLHHLVSCHGRCGMKGGM
jgi:uncharacterized membrane protein YuzA (DUF378 family)